MDYQIVPKIICKQHFMFLINLLVFVLLPYCECIVNRDLVLTPKQGLQLSGKRIFYEESFTTDEKKALQANDTAAVTGTRPWERTLKHVTYLTLFTNAANGIITGNFSKVKEYNDFMSSAYIRSPKLVDSRFGDIVTLADGRLERTVNGSYQFSEGNCDYECARESNIIALWHVQKIRHRDTADHKYHYEMKFSVSPIISKTPTETLVRGGPNKRTVMEERQNNNVQTFIQKEDDYPHSFRKIVTDKDEDFLERSYDVARNFRQVSQQYKKLQVTPIPQSTFLRGVYQQPPPPQPQHHQASMHLHHPNMAQQHSVYAHSHTALQHNPHQLPLQQLPAPERLNIGEFYKSHYVPKSSTKIELLPNLINMFMGKPQRTAPPATTFRPASSYQVKFPRPEIYSLQQHQNQEFPKFSEYQQPPLPHTQQQFNPGTPTQLPVITHHYHHHYFMPNNSALTIEQAIQNTGDQNENQHSELYHNEVTEVATPQGYVTGFYEEPPHVTTLSQLQLPQIQHQVQTHYHPNIQRQNVKQNYHSNYQIQQIMPPAPQKFIFPITQIEQQQVVHVTPAPPLKKPQYTQHQHQQQQYENRPYTSTLEYTTVHVPLLISYPASINDERRADVPTPRNKPFMESELLEDAIHYSEPDPLYANVKEGENRHQNKFIDNTEQKYEPQLESPDHYDQSQNQQQQNIAAETDNKKEHSESIEAQLPAPKGNEKAKATGNGKRQNLSEQTTSQTFNSIQIANEKITTNTIKTEASNSILAATKRPKIFALRNKRISIKTGTTTSSTNSTTTDASKTSTTLNPRKAFVSTSSTETPLKAISRFRNSYSRASSSSTSTTEKPVLKWTPKRKNLNTKIMKIKTTTTETAHGYQNIGENEKGDEYDDEVDENEDFKTNESNNLRKANPSSSTIIPIDFLLETTPATETPNLITTSFSSTMATLLLSPSSSTSSLSQPQLPTPSPSPLVAKTPQVETEFYEILTQKSVSKSVSLKVGKNGEEIPIIVDDEENEVNKNRK